MKEEFSKNYKDQNPYRVPEAYFPQKKEALKAIGKNPVQGVKVRKIKPGWWAVIGMAAALLIGFFLRNGFKVQASPALSTTAIEEYLSEEYPYSANEEILYQELQASDLEGMASPELTDDELNEFLDDNFDQSLHYEFL